MSRLLRGSRDTRDSPRSHMIHDFLYCDRGTVLLFHSGNMGNMGTADCY